MQHKEAVNASVLHPTMAEVQCIACTSLMSMYSERFRVFFKMCLSDVANTFLAVRVYGEARWLLKKEVFPKVFFLPGDSLKVEDGEKTRSPKREGLAVGHPPCLFPFICGVSGLCRPPDTALCLYKKRQLELLGRPPSSVPLKGALLI